MKNIEIVKTGIILWLLLALAYTGMAQKNDGIYSGIVDSAMLSAGGFSLKLKGDFSLIKQTDEAGKSNMVFINKTDRLVIRTWQNINDSLATKMILDKKFLIENLFIPQPSPYPDAVSNQVVCPDRLKPLPFDSIYPNIRIAAFRLFANNRYIYGECVDEVIVYTSAYMMVYNFGKNILSEIKYFTPKSNPQNIPEEVMRNIR